MSGSLTVVGLGPGDERFLTQEAENALAAAEALYGYRAYLDRVPARDGQTRHALGQSRGGARAPGLRFATLRKARTSWSSPAETPAYSPWPLRSARRSRPGQTSWRGLDVRIVPGITAMLAVAARAGAPLGHDFCAISLSDNLKPWELILKRLDAAAEAGFVTALYNPVSQARPWQLVTALMRIAARLPATTPVIFGRAVGRCRGERQQ